MEEQVKALERKLIAKERDIDDWVKLVRTIRNCFAKETEYYEKQVYELEMKLAKKDVEDENETINKQSNEIVTLKKKNRDLTDYRDRLLKQQSQLSTYTQYKIAPLTKELMLSEETAKLVAKYRLTEPQLWEVDGLMNLNDFIVG